MVAPRGAIVVGLDAGPDSTRGLDWAATAADRRGLALHLLHAMSAGYSELPPTPAEHREMRNRAESLLAHACARIECSHDVAVTTEVVERSPAPALIAASEKASMAVVGARGHGALFGLMLGSVSRHVAQYARCPVVVVREQADPAQRRIVVGVDGSPGSDEALGFAFETAAGQDAPLVAVLAWHERGAGTFGIGAPDRAKAAERIEAGERLLDGALAAWRARYPDVDLTREVVPGHPARVLADASAQSALVVVGSRGRGEFAGLLLGSVGQSVLHHARCPVAVVHRPVPRTR
ncbi:MAG TPA: universal stress protein [Pseudonocardia sp.]|nr:universal stress protein [Pseudonocardia sp.]